MQNILRQSFFDERGVPGQRALVFVFIAVRRNQVHTIRRATDSDFALRSAAHRANLLALRRTKARSFALLTNRTGHNFSSAIVQRLGSILRGSTKHKNTDKCIEDWFLSADSMSASFIWIFYR